MLTEQIVEAERIEIGADGSLHIRDATVILRGGVRDTSFPPRYRRYVLHPGASLDGRPEKAAAIAAVVWTPEVIEAWEAAHANTEA